jgi:predicted transcriptional regulator
MLKKVKEDIELISRHLEVLEAVSRSQPIGILKLSDILSKPHHQIRYSLRILEKYGYIQASASGAITTDRSDELFLQMNTDIDDIIDILTRMKHQ